MSKSPLGNKNDEYFNAYQKFDYEGEKAPGSRDSYYSQVGDPYYKFKKNMSFSSYYEAFNEFEK